MIHYSKKAIDLSKDERPKLIVVIDTEEEFDWNKPVNRSSTSVTSIQYINRVQDIFDEYNIVPSYIVDYPIASQKISSSVLKEIYQDNRCEIGAHLHPWVNPPKIEELIPENTYPGNLERSLEYQKIKALTDKIIEVFEINPTVYKAGRNGFGKNTENILKELGYQIDLSFSPCFNYSADGGGDYSRVHPQPFWFDIDKQLLEIPETSSFIGYAGEMSRSLYRAAQPYKKIRLLGIFSKMGLVDRLALSPEGYTSDEHVKLTNSLYQKGVRTFTWNFHSPTVVPGTTDYVNNEKELKVFLDSFRKYFDYFFNILKGEATTPSLLKSILESK
jgi:hypothetical protein